MVKLLGSQRNGENIVNGIDAYSLHYINGKRVSKNP
jgi:hypothetical protein